MTRSRHDQFRDGALQELAESARRRANYLETRLLVERQTFRRWLVAAAIVAGVCAIAVAGTAIYYRSMCVCTGAD
jgi:hypothetical protein